MKKRPAFRAPYKEHSSKIEDLKIELPGFQ